MFHVTRYVVGMVGSVAALFCTGLVCAQEWQYDLNWDGFAEQIIASPNGITESGVPAGVSTIEVIRGDTGQRLVVFYGDGPNDFSDPVVLDDISGDGLPDLIIPRPLHEEVVVLESFWDSEICDEFVPVSRGHVITSTDSEVYNFGFEVLPLYDIDGDNIGDEQIGAHRLGVDGQVYTQVYIYSGLHMALRAWADSDLPSTTLPKFAGDTTGDAIVTDADLDATILNLGATSADRAMGDLNNNGIVDSLDIVEVLTNLNQMGFLPQTDPNSPCEGDSAKYRSYIGSAGWSCVTTVPFNSFQLVPVFDEEGALIDVQGITPDSCGIIPCNIGSCFQDIHYCFHNYSVFHEAFVHALETCGSEVLVSGITINCEGLGDNDQPGLTEVICEGGLRKLEIIINTDELGDLDICQVLAHEFAHISQFCNDGLFTNFEEGFCGPYLAHITDYQRICRELRAYQEAGLDPAKLCEQVCRSVQRGRTWNKCDFNICNKCCSKGILNCCDGYVWVCPETKEACE